MLTAASILTILASIRHLFSSNKNLREPGGGIDSAESRPL
jgi:hypothetical protein